MKIVTNIKDETDLWLQPDTMVLGDCLKVMLHIPDKSIDLILCDLPYGVTQCAWDNCLDLDLLWKEYRRVVKLNGAIVLTAAQPFTSTLILSNPKEFRYDWVWDKAGTTGFLNAKRMPLRRHESILVFSQKPSVYYPQMEIRGAVRKKGTLNQDNDCYRPGLGRESYNNTYYPTSILPISNAAKGNKINPTQKPEALFEYLIKTYSLPGETVLDNCAGSFTTGVACLNTGRKFIGIEKDPEYFSKGTERVLSKLKTMQTGE